MKKKIILIVLIVSVVMTFIYFIQKNDIEEDTSTLSLQPVSLITLSGPAAESKAELSGLAWYDQNLILLPQYPNVFEEDGDGDLFYLPKSEILAYLAGSTPASLTPKPIRLVAVGLTELIPAYQGFESIGFNGDQVFLTIESGEGMAMMGHIISGKISPDMSTMTLDTGHIVDIPVQAKSENHSDESMLVLEDRVITFYEVIGKPIVANPVAHVFDFNLNPMGTIPMDNLEYRLTDTALAGSHEFWGINYFYPGDTDLIPASDPVSEKYGTGQSNRDQHQIERLVKFEYSTTGIHLMDIAPVFLTLDEEEVRNWEGLAMLDERGFLMATDKYPSTMLAFVPAP